MLALNSLSNLPRRVVRKAARIVDELIYRLPNRRRVEEEELAWRVLGSGVPKAVGFRYPELQEGTLRFVSGLRIPGPSPEYRYCGSSKYPTLYASTYACMIRSLHGDLDAVSNRERTLWVEYFDSFQDPKDGLFRDPVMAGESFEKEDWWGARHLSCHMVIAYTQLGGRPRHPFAFLEPFYHEGYSESWLESRDWGSRIDFTSNEVMNHGTLLQYSRDFLGDSRAGRAVKEMLQWLVRRINPRTGLWGSDKFTSPTQLSAAVQAAYHLYPLLLYDGVPLPCPERIIDHLLLTQNRLGGFGVKLNSSACEDIDTIEPLTRLARVSEHRGQEVDRALLRALPWILANENEDGGFVFRRSEGFAYGHPQMSSSSEESTLFATWFRTLSLAYLLPRLGIPNGFRLIRAPGYEFP